MGLAEAVKNRLGASMVIEAGGYGEALKSMERERLELAIFDLGMPDLTDPHVQLLHIRRQWPALKLVIYTASEDRNHIISALEAGVHGYILKKDNVNDLIKRLEYVLSGELYVPPILSEPPPVDAPVSSKRQVSDTNGKQAPEFDYKLSARQLQVLKCLVDGRSNKQIARDLDLAESTIKMHVGAVFRSLGVNNRAKAAAIGQRMFDAARKEDG